MPLSPSTSTVALDEGAAVVATSRARRRAGAEPTMARDFSADSSMRSVLFSSTS